MPSPRKKRKEKQENNKNPTPEKQTTSRKPIITYKLPDEKYTKNNIYLIRTHSHGQKLKEKKKRRKKLGTQDAFGNA